MKKHAAPPGTAGAIIAHAGSESCHLYCSRDHHGPTAAVAGFLVGIKNSAVAEISGA